MKNEIISEGFTPTIEWLDPTEDMLRNPAFKAIWHCIKTWDINVPEAYNGYCGANGNHVRAILGALGDGIIHQVQSVSSVKTKSEEFNIGDKYHIIRPQFDEEYIISGVTNEYRAIPYQLSHRITFSRYENGATFSVLVTYKNEKWYGDIRDEELTNWKITKKSE